MLGSSSRLHELHLCVLGTHVERRTSRITPYMMSFLVNVKRCFWSNFQLIPYDPYILDASRHLPTKTGAKMATLNYSYLIWPWSSMTSLEKQQVTSATDNNHVISKMNSNLLRKINEWCWRQKVYTCKCVVWNLISNKYMFVSYWQPNHCRFKNSNTNT